MDRIGRLDGLRGVAILGVLGFHLFTGFLPGGFLGVDLFFVLSGYLITSVLLRDGHLGRFYIRRALRILPPLVAAVLLAMVLHPVPGRVTAAALLFYANAVEFQVMGPLAHFWSLAVEEHFYLLWPAIFVLAARRRHGVLIAAIPTAIVVRLILLANGVENEFVYKLTPSRIDGLAIGCLLALAGDRVERTPRWLAPVGLAAIIACFAFVRYPSFPLLSFGFTGFAALCGITLASVLSADNTITARLLAHPAAQFVGRRSYGLYLYHWPIFTAMDLAMPEESAMRSVLKMAFTLLATGISYRTIERYTDRMKQRWPEATAQAQPLQGTARAAR